jgi:hypothetical protein
MTVKELIARLEKLNPDNEIMILDSFNGGGCPREINLGPVLRTVTAENADDAADCENLEGQSVYVIGFGCY